MSDNELLLAISDMMDKKLQPIDERLNKLETNMTNLESNVTNLETNITQRVDSLEIRMEERFSKINVILENEIRPGMKLLAENYLPSAIRYEQAVLEHETMKSDIELLEKVVSEHSSILQKIS